MLATPESLGEWHLCSEHLTEGPHYHCGYWEGGVPTSRGKCAQKRDSESTTQGLPKPSFTKLHSNVFPGQSGAFSPCLSEISWILRNPAIFRNPMKFTFSLESTWNQNFSLRVPIKLAHFLRRPHEIIKNIADSLLLNPVARLKGTGEATQLCHFFVKIYPKLLWKTRQYHIINVLYSRNGQHEAASDFSYRWKNCYQLNS